MNRSSLIEDISTDAPSTLRFVAFSSSYDFVRILFVDVNSTRRNLEKMNEEKQVKSKLEFSRRK